MYVNSGNAIGVEFEFLRDRQSVHALAELLEYSIADATGWNSPTVADLASPVYGLPLASYNAANTDAARKVQRPGFFFLVHLPQIQQARVLANSDDVSERPILELRTK